MRFCTTINSIGFICLISCFLCANSRLWYVCSALFLFCYRQWMQFYSCIIREHNTLFYYCLTRRCINLFSSIYFVSALHYSGSGLVLLIEYSLRSS
ncbi:hypothetical protein GDO81_009798 [Engystomops pustulosus]|uniref:NADH dehydrogenase subunit 4L n=1 Tax=Engystomops pustulosus TaxID=76066 RepID=A0AAV7BU49_ENGPU|nr:hypothetical protein GDO81_009798 [Engystomops pustulosus]